MRHDIGILAENTKNGAGIRAVLDEFRRQQDSLRAMASNYVVPEQRLLRMPTLTMPKIERQPPRRSIVRTRRPGFAPFDE